MKITFTLFAIFMFYALTAQENIIFSEDFEGDLTAWTIGDLDGDGHNWEAAFSSDQAEEQGWGPDMTLMAASFGYNLFPGEEGPLFPDNVLITPAIDFPADETITMNFLLGTNVDYLNNHNFALYVVEDFEEFDETWEPIFEMNFAGISTAQEISIDLSDYAGTTKQLVMRHFNSDEQFVLLLDDIVIISSTLGVEDLTPNVRLSIFPNPAQDFVTIRTDRPLVSAALYNAEGKLVKKATTAHLEIKELPKGIYWIEIKTDNELFRKQLIKK